MNWQDKAACSGMDVLLFFGSGKDASPEWESREEKAKAACASCPVRAQCLDYALTNSIKYGMGHSLPDRVVGPYRIAAAAVMITVRVPDRRGAVMPITPGGGGHQDSCRAHRCRLPYPGAAR